MSDDPPSRKLSRRSALKIGLGAAGGLAGCQSLFRENRSVEPTPATTPSESESGVSAWQPADFQLRTPWTGDVNPENPLPNYPRPQLTRREWRSLNGVWEFQPADSTAPPGTDTLSEEILVPYPVEAPLSGLGRHESEMWYRRTFDIPDDWEERVLLHFEAVDWAATVYVNGTKVGHHRGGYDSFSLDITDALTQAGEQELLVHVHDPTDDGFQPLGKQRLDPGGIYYTACSGIWQTVWLEPVPDTHITDLDVTSNVPENQVHVSSNVTKPEDATIQVTAFDGERKVAATTGEASNEVTLDIPDATLWTPDNAHLYDLRIEVRRNGEVVDAVGSYVGLRSVGKTTVNGTPRLTLNGDFGFQMATLDQGYWPDGIYRAPTDEALKSDLVRHKKLGFNAVRKHVKIEPRRWYYWADKLGLLVWQDMPSTAIRGDPNPSEPAQRQFETELRAMVEELRNHPSVYMWVPFNEGWGSYDVERIANAVKTWDSTRLVNSQSGINVCHTQEWADGNICGTGAASDVVDWHVYPGPDAPSNSGGKPTVLGEYGGMGLQIENHLWNPEEAYAYASMTDADDLTETYLSKLDQIREFMSHCGGLSAAVYTQISDVESEINGLLTYDRKVLKPDGTKLREAHRSLIEESKGHTAGQKSTSSQTGLEGIAYWPFDEGSGTIAHDSVNNHDGTLIDIPGEPPEWTTGQIGSALAFDGKHDFVAVGDSVVDTSTAFSVAAWVQPDELNTTMTVFSQEGGTQSTFELQYSLEDQQFTFGFPGAKATETTTVTPDNWYQLTGVVTGCDGHAKLYVDGAAGDSVGVQPPATEGQSVIGRGKENGNVAHFWSGKIDEVHVYDRALTRSEVMALYSQR